VQKIIKAAKAAEPLLTKLITAVLPRI
jgi:hypothetical protein